MSESKLHKAGASIDFWWNVIRAIIGAVALAGVTWVQFIGPGLKSGAQEFLGIREVIERMEFVEKFMPPPRVVDWNLSATRQSGDCTPQRCVYVMTGARTEYGEFCGKPSKEDVIPSIRTSDGQIHEIQHSSGFRPVELSRRDKTFAVPLDIPNFIKPGVHEWRTQVTYPTCLGRNEPQDRFTPWLPLTITEPKK